MDRSAKISAADHRCDRVAQLQQKNPENQKRGGVVSYSLGSKGCSDVKGYIIVANWEVLEVHITYMRIHIIIDRIQVH
jgi:hypothetical protein